MTYRFESLQQILAIFEWKEKLWVSEISNTLGKSRIISIDRKNQLLIILKSKLKELKKPFVNIIKYYFTGISIPQKSLKTRKERIENAKNTIFIDDKNIWKYKKIFLIDDFVWSGSTLNETGKKLKESWVKQIDWFAFVGNLNLSYDIINEI